MATNPSATFTVTLDGDEGKVGFIVPVDAIAALGAGNRPPVSVDVNGNQYRYTVAVMGGQHAIGVNKDIRAATGLKAGDTVQVTLTLDTSPRDVGMPDDFAAALTAAPVANAFFHALSNSLQRYHVGNVESSKTAETRQRRIDKAIDLFLKGKQR
jgi:hypothetical protein